MAAGTPAWFQDAARQESISHMSKALDAILAKGPEDPKSRADFQGFTQLFLRHVNETGPSLVWSRIKLCEQESILNYDNLRSEATISKELVSDAFQKLAVLKFNGGLGTGMGCTGSKSLISLRSDFTFLDLQVQQIEELNKQFNSSVPLLLMNSFNTSEETEKVLSKYQHCGVTIKTFEQSRYPRFGRESMLPLANKLDDENQCWYPPGHGDVFLSLYNSGRLEELIASGKEYLFVSNIDNLGATVDMSILRYMVENPGTEFLMEVTDKTRADVKGGTLVEYDGKLRLLEIAQVPKEHVDEFKSVRKFRIFNTNNLWIRLSAIKRVVENKLLDSMELIVNPKTLDSGLVVIQLETAVGAAIKCFEGARGVNVPRRRFLPVKTTSDLLTIMSNLYSLHNGSLSMSPLRSFPTVPLVKLGSSFTKVKDFLARFANIPNMLELDHLTVSGDVWFGKDVALKGTVIIIATHGSRIDIPAGSVLENKIVSGNLRIMDH